MSAKLKTAFAIQRAALGEFAAQIAATRKAIAKFKTEAEDVEGRFAPKASALAALDQWIAEQVQQGVRYAPIGDMLRGRASADLVPMGNGFALLMAACRDQVRQVLVDRIEASFGSSTGLTEGRKPSSRNSTARLQRWRLSKRRSSAGHHGRSVSRNLVHSD